MDKKTFDVIPKPFLRQTGSEINIVDAYAHHYDEMFYICYEHKTFSQYYNGKARQIILFDS